MEKFMKVNKEKIEIFNKKSKKDYTFCVLSDIHNTKYSKMKFWRTLVESVKIEKPDYIFIPGDFIYTADDLLSQKNKNKLEYLLVGLSSVAPTFACLGNHDLKKGKKLKAEDTLKYLKSISEKSDNFHILENEVFSVEGLNIIGLNPIYNAYYLKYKDEWFNYLFETLNEDIFSKISNDNLTVLLTHSPEIISESEKYINEKLGYLENKDEIAKLEIVRKTFKLVDLFSCGHMHDGLIPKHWQKWGIVKSDVGFKASEGDRLRDVTFRRAYKCRGIHNLYNGKLVITGGITKWCQPNIVFGLINELWSKDITIIKLQKMNK
jgi:predicted MPP superfamily phosphohydrolase